MPKTIKNSKTKTAKGYSLNDEDILNDMLLSFKMLVDNFAIALNEASNVSIYNSFLDMFEKISLIQSKLFETAFKNGWYSLEVESKSKVIKKFDEYNKKLDELKKQD